jgi:hypothetical protein
MEPGDVVEGFENDDLHLLPVIDLRLDLDPLVRPHLGYLVPFTDLVNALLLQDYSILIVHQFSVDTHSTIRIRFTVLILYIPWYI